MQPSSHPTPLPAEAMSSIWFNLHLDESFGISSDDVHYWRMLSFLLDDDLASLLLLKKLKLADFYCDGRVPKDVVTPNSFLEFRVDGGDVSFGQLVRPSQQRPHFAIQSDTRLGLGLLGLRSGQSILWPDDSDAMRPLEVLRVENCAQASERLSDLSAQS